MFWVIGILIYIIGWYFTGKYSCMLDRRYNFEVGYIVNAIFSLAWPVILPLIWLIVDEHSFLTTEKLFKKIGW